MVGSSDTTVAVPAAAQAVAVAALAALSERAPLLVVTATGLDAERLGVDLSCLLAPEPDGGAHEMLGALAGPVTVLPAWETLPFERVSPEIETMGRRLAVLHALSARPDESLPRPPRVVVAPVRALLQRVAPLGGSAPSIIEPGQQVDVDALLEDLVAKGYRREHQVEHRGEFAVRGGIVDVFPSTADAPARIDLWGDEIDRLTLFSVSDQRSAHDLAGVVVYGCRELIVNDDMRARAEELVGLRPWGTAVWDRLSRGEQFDGMESWLPFLEHETTVLPDLLGPSSQVVLVEPRRIRDRAAQLLDEEAALAETLAATWGAEEGEEEPFPRLHVPFERLLRDSRAGVAALPAVPEGPSIDSLAVGRFEQVAGDPSRLAAGVSGLVGEGYSVTLCAATVAGPAGCRLRWRKRASTRPSSSGPAEVPGRSSSPPRSPAASSCPRPRWPSWPRPTSRGGASRTGEPGPGPRATDGFFDDLEVGSFVVHRQHGVARFEGVTTRTMAGTTRDYLILQYRGSDRLYLPVEQIEAITPYSGGETPTLSKMGGADWQRTRAKARAAASEVAAELVQLYRRRLAVEGHAFGPDTPGSRRWRRRSRSSRRADQLQAIADVKADMEEPRPMDRLVCGDVGFGKTEVAVRAVFKAVQDGKQVAVLVPDHPAGQPASPDVRRALRRATPSGSSCSAASSRRRSNARWSPGWPTAASTWWSAPTGCWPRTSCSSELGLLVVDEEQRFGVTHKEAVKRMAEGVDVLTLTASPIPRTLEMALTGIRDLSMVKTPPADRRPILTYVGENDEPRSARPPS